MDRVRSIERFVFGVLAGFASIAPIPHVAAQPNVAQPDFSSNDAGWVSMGGDFTAVPGSPNPVGQDPAHPFVPNGRGRQPTYRIADLSNPNVKQWAKDIMKKDNDEVMAGKVAFTPRQSCVPSGVPDFIMFGGGEPLYFLQTPKEVVMIWQGDHQVRHVYLNVPHSAHPKPSWYGESVGHYDGDTLMVDTIGQSTKTFIDNFRTPHSERLRVEERWKLANDGKMLEVTVRLDDPETFNEPWSGVLRLRRVQQPIIEVSCAENNQHLFDYKIPVADEPDF